MKNHEEVKTLVLKHVWKLCFLAEILSRSQWVNMKFYDINKRKHILVKSVEGEQCQHNWPNSQIPECTCSISHNAPFRTEMCTFLFWMEHCGIWNRCILGFVKLVYFTHNNTPNLVPRRGQPKAYPTLGQHLFWVKYIFHQCKCEMQSLFESMVKCWRLPFNWDGVNIIKKWKGLEWCLDTHKVQSLMDKNMRLAVGCYHFSMN